MTVLTTNKSSLIPNHLRFLYSSHMQICTSRKSYAWMLYSQFMHESHIGKSFCFLDMEEYIMGSIKVPASPFCHSLSKGIHVEVIKRSQFQNLGVKITMFKVKIYLKMISRKTHHMLSTNISYRFDSCAEEALPRIAILPSG